MVNVLLLLSTSRCHLSKFASLSCYQNYAIYSYVLLFYGDCLIYCVSQCRDLSQVADSCDGCPHVLYYTVSQKNDSDVAHYNFNAHQPILVIVRRDIAERICY